MILSEEYIEYKKHNLSNITSNIATTMCNLIRANGEQCKLARNKDRCEKHQIIAVEQNNLEISILEEIPPQVNTPVIAEVVDTPAPSVIKPVEVSNVEVSKVPELDQSIIEPVIAEGVVYKEDQSSDLEAPVQRMLGLMLFWNACM
jgi:hypothetical protein